MGAKKASIENHLTLWRTLAENLDKGENLMTSLGLAKAALAGTPLEAVAAELMKDVTAGADLSKAMERHEAAFTRTVCIMVRAGEAGGVLEVVAERIEKGLRDGAFTVPGIPSSEANPQAGFWLAFHVMLSSGVPILHALALLSEEIADPTLVEALDAVRQSILEGGSMHDAMSRFPDTFAPEICAAVERGETEGCLDAMAERIAAALKSGDLAGLPLAAAPAPEQPPAVVRYVNELLARAMSDNASDVHLDPTGDGSVRVRVRIDGALTDAAPPSREHYPGIVNRIKIMANLDVAERRLPQDGRIQIKLSGRECVVRVSVAPVQWGERLVLRLMRPDVVVLKLDQLGCSEANAEALRGLCRLRHGLVICSGPTGCGKTTLLYALVAGEIDHDKLCVMSVEDPIEFRFEGIGQIQVRPRIGVTFPRALRTVMQQDPDVVMVGEASDLETLNLTMHCALTGHLVFTQMHASTAAGAIRRLLDMGIEPYLISSALAGVTGMRLVRTLCPDCKQPCDPDPRMLGEEAGRIVRGIKDAAFHAPKGCDACRGTGYRGRAGVFEILTVDDCMLRAIVPDADVASLHEAAVAAGMKPMLVDGIEKAARGITSLQEVLRVLAGR